MPTTTTTQAIDLFKTSLVGGNFSPKTVRAYIDDVRQFTKWFAEGSVSADDPKTIGKLDINKFLGALAQKRTTGKTRYRKVVAIKKFFAFLQEHRMIANNPAVDVIPPLKEKRLPHVLKKNEYKALLFEAEKNPRDYAIIQTILQTGLRISEVTNLTVGDVDLINKTLTVRQGKGKVDRIIDLPDIAVAAISAYLKGRGEGSDDKLFLSRNRKGMYVTTVRLAVHKYLKKAGITRGAVHTLRHTFGTYKSLNGVPPKILQGIMGHKKLESTLLYVHLVDTEVRQYQRSTPL
jgi:site-specific recombinase XerD